MRKFGGFVVQGLGAARRIDEAFYVLESVERGTAVGGPKLSAPLVLGLLNALVEAGLNYEFEEYQKVFQCFIKLVLYYVFIVCS